MLNIKIGEKPKPQEYQLTEKDVKDIESRNPIGDYLNITLWGIGFVASFMYGLYQDPDISIISIVAWTILGGAAFWFAFQILLLFLMGLFPKVMLKVLDWKPQEPTNYIKYKEAIAKWEKQREETNNKFHKIEKFNYAEDSYTKNAIHGFITKLSDALTYRAKQNDKQWWIGLSPDDFEHEIAKHYERLGYKTRVTKQSNDGGVDVIARNNENQIYIQCKHYGKTSSVSVGVIRELYGVMNANAISHGAVATLYGVTQQAQEFANKAGIDILTLDDYCNCKDYTLHKLEYKHNVNSITFRGFNQYYKYQIWGELFEIEDEARYEGVILRQELKPPHEFSIFQIGSFFIIVYGQENALYEIRDMLFPNERILIY